MRIEFGDGIDYVTSSKDQLQIQLEKEEKILQEMIDNYRRVHSKYDHVNSAQMKIDSQLVKVKKLRNKIQK